MDTARVIALLRPHLEATGTRWMLAGGLAPDSVRATFERAGLGELHERIKGAS